MGATFSNIYPHLHEKYFGKGKEAARLFGDITEISPVMAYAKRNKADTEGGGRTMVFPITTALGSPVNPTFVIGQAKAQGATAGSAMTRNRWEVSPTTIDAFAVWSRDTILRANRNGNAGYIANIIKEEMDARIKRLRNMLCTVVTEAGWGRVGVIVSGATTSLVLSSTYANRLEIGDDLVASSSEDGAVLRDSGTAARITGIAVDAVAGTTTLTMSADVASAGWTAGDTLFMEGWRQNSATPTRLVPAGTRIWAPTTAPTDTFNGIVRTGNPAYSAARFNCSGISDHASAFIKLVLYAQQKNGTKVDAIITSPEDVAIMLRDAEANKIADVSGKMGPYEISFSGIGVRTSQGIVPVQSDASFLPGTALAGPWNSKTEGPILAYTMDEINVDDFDGNQMLRLAGSAAYESRMFFDGNFIMPAIGLYSLAYNLPTS